MKPKVYVETTVVSYLTARPSSDIIIAGHQRMTRDWWDSATDSFELVASETVVREAQGGEPAAAQERLDELRDLPLLESTDEALSLAEELVRGGAIPEVATEDALHIAIAVTNGIEYLVTWNLRHIANARMRSRIDDICRRAGYETTTICTPEELMETP